MNFETCWRLLVGQVNRRSQDDIDMAMISVINAMNFYKSHKFDFNKGWEQVHLLAGVERLNSPSQPAGYPAMRPGMPAGMKRAIVIQVVGIVTDGDVETGLGTFSYQPTDQLPLKQVSEEYLWERARGVGELSTASNGWPEMYCWLGDGSIRIFPAPFTDMVADVYFLKDAHRPRYRWDSGSNTWAFEMLSPVSTAGTSDYWQWVELDPDFTNMWLEKAEPLIRARARYDLYKNFYGDLGSSQVALSDVRDEEQNHIFEAASGVIETIRRIPQRL